MKLKKVMLSTVIFFMAFGAQAQLKVSSNGRVGIHGMDPVSNYALSIYQPNGASSTGGSIRMYGYGHNFRLGQYTANAHIASSNDEIVLYYGGWQYFNDLVIQDLTEISDESLKTDIKPIENGMDLIMNLNAVSYLFKEDLREESPSTNFGFIAQEVQKLEPGLTKESMGLLGIKYTHIIPFIVKGMQEQQAQIDSKDEMIAALDEEINDLKNLIFKFADMAGIDISEEGERPAAVLYQNKPNPFKDQTVINYELPENCTSASIMIFDMTGEMLELYPVSPRDGGMLTIEGKAFKPGMYLYSLIVDDVEVDTKRMILSK